MRSIATLMTRGRVTIPKAIRDELGLEPYDRIRFMLEDGCAVLQKTYPSLEELAGSIPTSDPMSVEEAIELAKDEHAQQFIDTP